jgi:hypothetical protein
MTGVAMRMMIARLSGEAGRTGLQVTDGELVIRDTVRKLEEECNRDLPKGGYA